MAVWSKELKNKLIKEHEESLYCLNNMMKRCFKCKKMHQWSFFPSDKTGKYGRDTYCYKCKPIMDKRYPDKYAKEKSKPDYLEKCRIKDKRASEKLLDSTVRSRLYNVVRMPYELIPDELVELKRIQLKLYREIHK